MANTLVTGSAGHLGEGLMRVLATRGEAAVGLDIRPSPWTSLRGSLCNRDLVRCALAGVDVVFHTAALHKPHVVTHRRDEFIETNIQGTLILLEEAVRAGVRAFVHTSTTSAFGSALVPAPEAPSTWITESVRSIPKNIYGVSKSAGEDVCELFARRHDLPCIVLRTSRFFPEADDNAGVRNAYDLLNVHANELLYRRADLADVVEAHLVAAERATELRFGKYIISATTPFAPEHSAETRSDPHRLVASLFPDYEALYRAAGWRMFETIDRIYDNARARAELGWSPRYDFRHVLSCLAAGTDFRSPLARDVGSKGYHSTSFGDEPYPVE